MTISNESKTELMQKVVVAVLAALLTFLATIAYAGMTTMSRAEIDHAIKDSESRTTSQILELKTQQNQILDKLETISQDQIRLSTKFDLTFKQERR